MPPVVSESEYALTRAEHSRLAELIIRAASTSTTIETLTRVYPEMTIADACRVRDLTITRRVASGERIVGAKVVVLDQPRIGWITDGMLQSGVVVSDGLIAPRVELKLCLELASAVEGPLFSIEPLLAAAAGLFACLEVVDARFDRRVMLARDAVADNCCTAALVICEELMLPDLAGYGCERSVLSLARQLLRDGGSLDPGTLLVSTPIGRGVPLLRGSVVDRSVADRMLFRVAA